jgi:hypothetical protein
MELGIKDVLGRWRTGHHNVLVAYQIRLELHLNVLAHIRWSLGHHRCAWHIEELGITDVLSVQKDAGLGSVWCVKLTVDTMLTGVSCQL